MEQLLTKLLSNPKVVGNIVPSSVVNSAVNAVGSAITKLIFKC